VHLWFGVCRRHQSWHESLDNERAGRTAEEEAYRHLLRASRSGRYKPGDRLLPEDISAEIDMNRIPVRECAQVFADLADVLRGLGREHDDIIKFTTYLESLWSYAQNYSQRSSRARRIRLIHFSL
jgi:hypothetical protein